uniref:HYR domain-containing protein n=1 Tax=Sphingomonas sp. TaxID=28214 RepID=UPI0025CCEA14
ITWNVTDANGNAAITQTQTVTVTDNQKPVISGMPSNITRNAVVNNCLALVTWAAPTANDNCGIASFSSSDEDYNSLGFTLLPVGVHTITYTATDVHGNVQTASFTVTVVDNQNPIITGCPGTIAVNNAAGTCGQQVFWNPPTASDNCPGVTLTGSHVPGSIFPVGTTVVTYTATDAVGLVTTCSFNVVVTDNEKPVVSNCPANITVNTGAGNSTCRQTATWNAPTATDNCGNVTVSSTHQPGAIFAIGTTTVTYTFTDVHNNVSSCSFDVTVRDNTAPVPDVASLPTITAECSATASVPTATDNCGGVINGVPSGPTSFTTQGTHTITWTYTDAAGNASTQTQTVVIDDNTPPVIACPFDIVVNATPGMCGTVVTYNQPSATDNCGGGNLPTSIPGYTYKGTFNGHSYFVSNTQARPEAAHAAAIALGGHLATISNATENALISGFLPGQRMWIGFTDRDVEGTYRWVTNEPITYTNWSGGEPNNAGDEDWAVINWSGPTWNDWYYEQPAYYVVEFEGGAIPTTLVSGPASGSVFPVGTTVVTWSATDAGGNTVTCSFRVTVKDVEAPRITCPSNINAIATSAAGAVVNYTEPVGTDNCSGAVTTRIAGPASGSTFPIGSTLVTYRVTDAAGLTTQCSFTVTVVGVPPSVNCPANIVVSNTQGECGTNVNFAATETQAIPASTITYSHQPGSFFPVGSTVVTATATNPVGTSVCTFTVTVNDAENPKLIGVPANETVECTAVPSAAVVTATDNCGNLGAVEYKEVKADGNCAGNYTLTRTWSVTDAHNNTTTATQVITVVDTKAPVIATQASDATVECDGNGNTSAFQDWLNSHGGATATDDCSGVTWTNNFSTGNWVADCGGTKHVTVVFTATDGCGNASNTTATFRIKDETAPAVVTAAGSLDRVVECSDASAIAAANALVPSATDDCSQVTLNLVSDVTTPGCGSTYVRVRQWNFTDACGNTSATYKQTITAKDETAPVITCPASVTLNCQDDNSTAATGVATATDNCSTPVVSYSDVSTQSSNVNDAAHYNYTITRTWKAVDACNNASTCVQTITVQDVTKPVITCPASVT